MITTSHKFPISKELEGKLCALLQDYRARCLWFVKPDYVPTTYEEWLKLLVLIERYGDLAAFKRVAELRQWL